MAAGLSVDLDGWRREFDELMLADYLQINGGCASLVRSILSRWAR